MPAVSIASSQRTAARVVGASYLLALPPALFAELYAFGRLIVPDDLVRTTRNILDHEQLFRFAIAGNLFVFALDIVLIAALYIVLKPVSPPVALVAALWRLVETTILVFTTVADLLTLRLLHEPSPNVALSLGAHATAYGVALAFAGLGTTLFCYLWYSGELLPKPLAGWGMFAGAVLAVSTFSFVMVPELKTIITLPYFGGPIFLFELVAGAWLLLKGLPSPVSSTRCG